MRVTFLGCGTSGGVPQIDTGYGMCDPREKRNTRFRSSVLFSCRKTNLLVDVGPDFRSQYLQNGLGDIHAIVLTHMHADHVAGLDDLRGLCNRMGTYLPLYVYKDQLPLLWKRFDYALLQNEGAFRGPPFYRPVLLPIAVDNLPATLKISGFSKPVTFFGQNHGSNITMGVKIGRTAYSTDVSSFPPQTMPILQNLDLWIVDCLRKKPHPSHATIQNILDWTQKFAPKEVFLTHMSNYMDYNWLCRTLPPNIRPAYDGLVLSV